MTTLIHILQGVPAQADFPALVRALGWTLLHFCWQGAAVAALLWCALALLPVRMPQARYAAASLALALMVAMPLATFARLAEKEIRASRELRALPMVMAPAIVVDAGGDAAPEPLRQRVELALDDLAPWVPVAWLAGVVVFLARLNLGLIVARRMRSAVTEPAQSELREMMAGLSARLGVRRAVRLVQSAMVEAPTVIGWLRPVVLIPVGCLTGLSAAQVEAILAHELAHIRRHDYLVSVMQSVVEALLFYHPAVWWVSKQMRRERESCCDDAAVKVSGDRIAYARALSWLEEHRAATPELALGANGGVLTMRIRRLLGLKESAAVSRGVAIALLAVVLAGTLWYAGAMGRAQSSQAQLSPATPVSAPRTIDKTGTVQFKQQTPQLLAQSNETVPPPTAAAAPRGGSIAGVIVDPTGALVPRAQVWVVNTDTGKARATTVTGNDGRYFAPSLPPGPYNVEVEAKGFKRLLQENVHVAAKQQVELDIKLSVSVANETVSVTGTPAPPPPSQVPVVEVTPAKPVGPMRVSAGVLAGNLVSKVDPVYPDVAKKAHVQGAVVLQATIAKDGTVKDLQYISGAPMLVVSAIEAVEQWKYKPYLLNGEPTEVETSITVNYALNDSAKAAMTMLQEYRDMQSAKQIGYGVSAPVLIYQVPPEYTPEAKQAKIEGTVLVNLVVNEVGAPEDVHVLRGLGNGLDDKAVEAVKQYKFKPAMEDGTPVPVTLNIEVNFKIF
jgi:TonB family protein